VKHHNENRKLTISAWILLFYIFIYLANQPSTRKQKINQKIIIGIRSIVKHHSENRSQE
jgi:hypothetical protein